MVHPIVFKIRLDTYERLLLDNIRAKMQKFPPCRIVSVVVSLPVVMRLRGSPIWNTGGGRSDLDRDGTGSVLSYRLHTHSSALPRHK